MSSEGTIPTKKRIFISYKRNADPDERIALEVFHKLSASCDVFIDQTMGVGARWAEHIEAELRRSDFLIPFLSSHSVRSEMVLAEIETAHNLYKQHGCPNILPVRLAFTEPFEYPLSAYLNPINWAVWQDEGDTPALIETLSRATNGELLPIKDQAKPSIIEVNSRTTIPEPPILAQPITLETPEGTMRPESEFYVSRKTDNVALEAIRRLGGVTITIKGPRQIGKSSLLMRVIDIGVNEIKKKAIFLDFQLFNRASMGDADTFFKQFCARLSRLLHLENKVDSFWDPTLSNSQLCTDYVEEHILTKLNMPLVLAMDEVESVFDTDFRSDFFSMLRAWHNSRARPSVWRYLDLALVTSTEPYQFIENLNLSPFNVGEVISVPDFTLIQSEDLNQRHGTPFSTGELEALMQLVGGHPYLLRKAFYLVVSKQISISDLFARSAHSNGPFGDHLRHHLFRLHGRAELVVGLRQVLENNVCSDEKTFFRLQGAGLVRREENLIVPRCDLYSQFFKEHLNA
jgi:hypothetical protein